MTYRRQLVVSSKRSQVTHELKNLCRLSQHMVCVHRSDIRVGNGTKFIILRGTYAKTDQMGGMILVPNASARVCVTGATTRRRKSPVVRCLRLRYNVLRVDNIESLEGELLSQQEPMRTAVRCPTAKCRLPTTGASIL